jgi:hypothetical protein
MAWDVEYTNEFEEWWTTLDADTQNAIDVTVGVLEQKGPDLPFPLGSGIKGSRHRHMRELRVQHKGRPYRILYAFDPRRVAILLIGGLKAGSGRRWYERYVPWADDLYDQHLREIRDEGRTDG